ncbi:alpha-xylosidase [Demequina lignilytica]|uniref:alpha-D-xyloside xylohydrolase n=1 Tax=Demequina lignilytica TaxID=3051663 RepID=A0AB35MHT0_9MICO|nr:alpha-xylosidase [Demequina sp. SYSU T0a273]MDN4483270.1 alpha-xylosidase [Demequina sp. SYSU T0a273]
MKFTDGFWLRRPGVTAHYAQETYDLWADGDALVAYAPTKRIVTRGDTLGGAALTVTLTSPLEGVVRVRIDHHQGAHRSPGFRMPGAVEGAGAVTADDAEGTLTSGRLTARITHGAPWALDFEVDGVRVTGSGHKSLGYMELADGAPVPAEPAGVAGYTDTGLAPSATYVHEQLDLDVAETIYGLGERFGPFVRNGQTVDLWNADGGTSSEQSYKNVPFYLSSKGYGVLINQPEHVSVEVGTEAVERVQFSTAGESLEYLVFAGPTPADVIERYTALMGRPPRVPAWSFGLWLSTSFTTDYDEATVNTFVDGMRDRDVPLSVFHYDCFWMREFNWTDGEWDPRTFPEPERMLERMHVEKDLHVSAWINPYIAQRGRMFREGVENGYLVKRPDGTVWQWDLWQPGMALVDFTNLEARAWFQEFVRNLARQGVDAIKTDFGERIPTDVVWHDGTAPETMHNLYTQLYNEAVWEALVDVKGEGNAVLFARSATAGGQTMPVHWGGDNSSSYVSMAETLRGGLSLMSSGFGYWSHDIGGFEGTPDASVFKRWLAFGLMGSHSRLHGSNSYRVPWAFDDEAVDVARTFTRLKLSLMPYLYAASVQTAETGLPMMRPMFIAFPGDPACQLLDRQYMLGDDILVAPVFHDSEVQFYLPEGTWTSLLTGERVEGGRWVRESHGFESMPVYVREGAVIARGTRDDRPDYDFLTEVELHVYPGADGDRRIVLHGEDGASLEVTVTVAGEAVTAIGANGETVAARLA